MKKNTSTLQNAIILAIFMSNGPSGCSKIQIGEAPSGAGRRRRPETAAGGRKYACYALFGFFVLII
jgi:hypothetical protein